MTIKISKETRKELVASIRRYFAENMDDEIGDLKASLLLDFALQEIGPAHIVPAHCTGLPAQIALSAAMPEAFVTPAVGSRLELTAWPQ